MDGAVNGRSNPPRTTVRADRKSLRAAPYADHRKSARGVAPHSTGRPLTHAAIKQKGAAHGDLTVWNSLQNKRHADYFFYPIAVCFATLHWKNDGAKVLNV